MTALAIRGALTFAGVLGWALWLGAEITAADHAIAAERYERAYQRCVTTTTYELMRTEAAFHGFRSAYRFVLEPGADDE